MKLIIDIDEEEYNTRKNTGYFSDNFKIVEAVAKGIPFYKIIVEIEQTTSRYTISRERGTIGQVEWSDRLIKESEVLEILKKYKVESEE